MTHALRLKCTNASVSRYQRRGKGSSAGLGNRCGMNQDKKAVLEAVKRNGLYLVTASEELKEDKEVVLAAVRQNGTALRHASELLQEDREVVLAAVENTRDALQYAHKDLHKDLDVVLAANLSRSA